GPAADLRQLPRLTRRAASRPAPQCTPWQRALASRAARPGAAADGRHGPRARRWRRAPPPRVRPASAGTAAMSALPHAGAAEPPDAEYEDLLGQWSDLEAFVSTLLARPASAQAFPAKVRQCELWLADLVAHDVDAALYLMFQLASTSTVGYSASHALVCAALCHVLALELQLPALERSSLVRAAFTMNIGM